MTMYNVLSPDEIPISATDFSSEDDAVAYYYEWEKRFKKQGYYSSNDGRIDLLDLPTICTIIEV